MIDESDLGQRLANLVAARISSRYPRTDIVFPIHSTELHGTVVTFTPPNVDGVVVSLVAWLDWSFDLDAGGFKYWDQEGLKGGEAEQVERIVAEVVRLAEQGVHRNRLDRWLSNGDGRFASWEQ